MGLDWDKQKRVFCQGSTIKSNNMLWIHPEKHTNQEENHTRTEKLIERARKGEILLILEDHQLAQETKHAGVISLEASDQHPVEMFMGLLIWTLDTSQPRLQDLGNLGMLLFFLYVYICFRLKVPITAVPKSPELRQAMKENPPDQSMAQVLTVTKQHCVKVLGGVPGSLRLDKIRAHMETLVSLHSHLIPEAFAIYHGLIVREQKMWTTIQEALRKRGSREVHLVVGANHVAGLLSDEQVLQLGIHAQPFRELERDAETYYPGERLFTQLSEYTIVV